MLMGAMMPTRAAIMVTRTVVMMRTMAMLGTVAMTPKVTARTCMPVLLDAMITVKREMEVTRKPSKLSRTMSTLSAGRASGPWPGASPGPALKGPGSGQNFDGLAHHGVKGQHIVLDPTRPGPGLTRPDHVERCYAHVCFYFYFFSNTCTL